MSNKAINAATDFAVFIADSALNGILKMELFSQNQINEILQYDKTDQSLTISMIQ